MKQFALIAAALCALSLPAGAQQFLDGSETSLRVATGRGTAEFLVSDPLAVSSAAWRVNTDLADKVGRIPSPSTGYTLFAAVVVETEDLFTLENLAAAYGAAGLEPIDAAPGFWLVRTATVRAAVDLAEVYRAAFGPQMAYVDVEHPRTLRGVNDPRFSDQWHLENNITPIADSNIRAGWNAGYTGVGVVIGVLEGGFETTHPDLAANYNAAASQSGGSSGHGTGVAGVAAAVGDNGIGVVGAAYNAGVSKQYFGSNSQTAVAFGFRNDLNDIKNNSWGPFDNGTIAYISSVELAALENGVATGRGGLGELYTWAAGNGGTGDRVEYDPYASSRLTLAIGAIGDSDTRSSYNETGSSMLVVSHTSGNNRAVTTTASGGGYTSSFGGTSAASPHGSGVIALMLEANPTLSWRDVQHVLIHSARKNDPGRSSWTTNAAGHDISYDYGFGAITAGAAVSTAAAWTNVGTLQIESSGVRVVNTVVPDNNTTGIQRSISVSRSLDLEFVEVVVNVDTTYVGDLRIELTGPTGTRSLFSVPRSDSQDDLVDYVFTSRRHWGEDSPGTWTLSISDEGPGDIPTWVDWELILYGTEAAGDMLLAITPDPLDSGQLGTFDVSGGNPNALTYLAYARFQGSTFIPQLNVTLGLNNFKQPAGPVTSNASGDASWAFVIPARGAGRSFFVQSAQFGRISNVVPIDVN